MVNRNVPSHSPVARDAQRKDHERSQAAPSSPAATISKVLLFEPRAFERQVRVLLDTELVG